LIFFIITRFQTLFVGSIFFSKLEFEVKDLKNDGDIEKLKSNLLQKKGITSIQTVVNENESKIFVETTLPARLFKNKLKEKQIRFIY
jgi:hypothetical protein